LLHHQLYKKKSKLTVILFFVLTLVTSGSVYAFVTGDLDPNFSTVFATSSSDGGKDGGGGGGNDGGSGGGGGSDKKGKSSGADGGELGGGGSGSGGQTAGGSKNEDNNKNVVTRNPGNIDILSNNADNPILGEEVAKAKPPLCVISPCPAEIPPDPKDISSEKQAEQERSSEEIGSGEICDNGVDDDGDGKVDFADSDCSGIKSAPRGTALSQSPIPTPDSKGFIRGSGAPGAPLDPGTATEPGPPYSDEDEAGEKCGFAGIFPYCLEPSDQNPGMPKFSNDEICNNGKDDDGDGKVDEVPYCFDRNRQAYGPPPTDDGTLTPTPSQGPSPFGP
jgi:hypothetical protein